jgi:hypothetical protein
VANLCYLCAALHQIDGVSGQELCRSKTIAVAASLLKYNQVKSELVVGQVTRIMKLPVLIFCLIGGTSGFAPMQRSQATPAALSMADANVDLGDRRSFVAKSAATAGLASLATMTSGALPAPASAASKMWTPVELPFEDTLYDIDFDR